MVIALDFDGVIHDVEHPAPDHKMGPPIEGALEYINRLKAMGHELVIYTTRAATPQSTKVVQDWLVFYHMPALVITDKKPKADLYIDDKALRFTNWVEAFKYVLTIT